MVVYLLVFTWYGYNIKGMIDFDEDSLETAEVNNLAEHYLNLDLFKANWLEKFLKQINFSEVDIIVADLHVGVFINWSKKA